MPNVGFFLVMLAVVIFVVGFTAGYIFENITVSYTQQEVKIMRLALENMQIEEMFVASESVDCNLIFATLGSISYNIYEMNNRLKSTSPETEEFLSTKREADLLSLKAWIFAKKISEKCTDGILPVLLVYSTDCQECGRQEAIIQDLKEEHEGIVSYSIDRDTSEPAIKLVINSYNITDVPAMIVGSNVYGSMEEGDMETLFCNKLKC